jgi:plastocyanin
MSVPKTLAKLLGMSAGAALLGLAPAAVSPERARADVAGPGVVEGIVRWSAETLPQPARVQNATDPEACGRVQILDELAVNPRNRGIPNVIVALADIPRAKIPVTPPQRLSLDNRGCRFVPHAAVLTTGSTIEATNSDPVLHTVHFYGALERNLALAIRGLMREVVVPEPGWISVRCDVHGWMSALIRVDPHPFHAVSGENGRYAIAGVPPGVYTLEARHAKLGAQRQSVLVEAGRTSRVDLEFRGKER